MYSSYFYFRPFHTSSALRESKVEETLEAIKDTIKEENKKKEQALQSADQTVLTPESQAGQAIPTTPAKEFTFIEAPPKLTPTGTNLTADNVKVNLVPQAIVIHKVPLKLSLTTRFVNELKHYYHGFRLLFIDARVAVRLIWAVLNGKTLMRREKKQVGMRMEIYNVLLI